MYGFFLSLFTWISQSDAPSLQNEAFHTKKASVTRAFRCFSLQNEAFHILPPKEVRGVGGVPSLQNEALHTTPS